MAEPRQDLAFAVTDEEVRGEHGAELGKNRVLGWGGLWAAFGGNPWIGVSLTLWRWTMARAGCYTRQTR